MLKAFLFAMITLHISTYSYAADREPKLVCGFFQGEEQEYCRFRIFTHSGCVLRDNKKILQCSYDIGVPGLNDELNYFTWHDPKLYESVQFYKKKSLLTGVFIVNGIVQIEFDVSTFLSSRTFSEVKVLIDENLKQSPHIFGVQLDKKNTNFALFVRPI